MRELPNFRRALDLTLAAGDLDAAASFANSIARFLDAFGRWSERDAMMAQVDTGIRDQGSAESAISSQQSAIRRRHASRILMRSQQGERLLQQGRAAQAERVFRDLLGKLGDAPSYERAMTLGNWAAV